MAGRLCAAFVSVRGYVGSGARAPRVLCQPNGGVQAISKLGHDLVFLIEDFAYVNWVEAARTVATRSLFRRDCRRIESGVGIAVEKPSEQGAKYLHICMHKD